MSLVILCVAAFALVSAATSASVGLGLHLLRRPMAALAPSAQARLYLASALLPFVASIAVLMAALAPSFGWISDHYGHLGVTHSHPHLCATHPLAGWPAVPLMILALVMSARLFFSLGGLGYGLLSGARTRRDLDRLADREENLRVLPVDDVQAFVLGIFRPTIYVTRGLITGKSSEHLPAVIAHEQAHLHRLDPMRRLVARFGLAFHLPFVSNGIDKLHVRAQEMSADETAAGTVGSREDVALALVALAKTRFVVPQTGFAVSSSNVEERVLQLMDERERSDWPTTSTLAFCAALAFLVIAVGADDIHHRVESLLGSFGS